MDFSNRKKRLLVSKILTTEWQIRSNHDHSALSRLFHQNTCLKVLFHTFSLQFNETVSFWLFRAEYNYITSLKHAIKGCIPFNKIGHKLKLIEFYQRKHFSHIVQAENNLIFCALGFQDIFIKLEKQQIRRLFWTLELFLTLKSSITENV